MIYDCGNTQARFIFFPFFFFSLLNYVNRKERANSFDCEQSGKKDL